MGASLGSEDRQRQGTANAPAGTPQPWVRVGTDVIVIADVAASVVTFGDRYVERVYTPHEIASCAGAPTVFAAGLAARFAAKEATIKVLRPVVRPGWTSIEVRKTPGGWCEMHLSGEAARLAGEAGIADLAVSLSRAGGLATAVVVATGTPSPQEEAWTS